MLDSDRRWVLTEAASELAGNLTYADQSLQNSKIFKEKQKSDICMHRVWQALGVHYH